MSEIVLLVLLVFASTAIGGEAWLSPSRDLAPRPNSIPGVAFPSDATLEANGWTKVSVPDCDAKYWLRDGNAFSEMSREQKDAVDAAEAEATAAALAEAEAARIAAKPDALKRAENAFINAVMSWNYVWGSTPETAITTEDGFLQITAKIEASGMEKIDKLETGMKLRTLWDVVLFHGGKFGDVQYHQDVGQ